jgi:hypothetical protein
MALIPCWRRRIATRMNDCIAMLGYTYIGGGGPTRGGAPGSPPPTLTLQGTHMPKYEWAHKPNMGPVYIWLNTILTITSMDH